ncbi:MAG TPA: YebC/PmpR family DNA-binding transcriptional regulator [Candidatus Bipolaricaulota bacterium]|nr:YebC/PmpR family DNA-binding transcriptional regulator [Candidatus Bipolaricaulota bacterium]
MSGHSKWATTHRQKEASDKKKASVFTKLARNIILAAREGKDPEANFKLRLAIDQARASNMPKDNIERAIARGAGELGGDVIEEVLYEAFGPAGVGLLIEGTTDNRNRTVSDVKAVFNKMGGALGGANSVKWMFEQKGVIRVPADALAGKSEDQVALEIIDFGADDVKSEEGGLTVLTTRENLKNLENEIRQAGLSPDYAGLEWISKEKVEISADDKAKLEEIIEALEDSDDISCVYSNAKN